MDRDEPEPLPVVDLDDAEVGLRAEDRYAAIPPGPRLIRRRERHSGSGTGAIALLGGLLALFVAASWLGGLADDDDTQDAGHQPIEPLSQPTGATLLLLGTDGVATLDVDARVVEPQPVAGLPTIVTDGAWRGDGIVTLGDGAHFVVLERGQAHELGAATSLSASANAAWIGVDDGTVTRARPVRADGSLGTDRALDGLLVGVAGEWLVVARPDGALALRDPSGATNLTLGDDLELVAASPDIVAVTEAGCRGRPCDLRLVDTTTGESRVVDDALGQPGLRSATFSPDGDTLAVTFSDGIVARGLLVDVASGGITRFSTDSVRRERASMAWSGDGAWLFLAVERGRIEAVDRAGTSSRVDVELPRFDVLLSADG